MTARSKPIRGAGRPDGCRSSRPMTVAGIAPWHAGDNRPPVFLARPNLSSFEDINAGGGKHPQPYSFAMHGTNFFRALVSGIPSPVCHLHHGAESWSRHGHALAGFTCGFLPSVAPMTNVEVS